LNVDLISFETICNHFLLFGALVKKKKFAKAMHLFGLILLGVFGALEIKSFLEKILSEFQTYIVDKIKFISRFWFISRIWKSISFAFFD
jgi:hypothetical protein